MTGFLISKRNLETYEVIENTLFEETYHIRFEELCFTVFKEISVSLRPEYFTLKLKSTKENRNSPFCFLFVAIHYESKTEFIWKKILLWTYSFLQA